jgi:poly-gamma-glutamate capsule biosynthesis protein CapA/YwtB (metallophosphatase superfamily)
MGRNFVLEMVVSGDLVLDEPDAGHWLSGIAPALQGADVAVGHLEVPHTGRGVELAGDVPAPGAPPENLAALAEAGFDMLSLGGNHIADCGPEGIEDTIAGLNRLGIVHTGAAMKITEARRPARIEAQSRRIALLS